jgi:hypothetical protein
MLLKNEKYTVFLGEDCKYHIIPIICDSDTDKEFQYDLNEAVNRVIQGLENDIEFFSHTIETNIKLRKYGILTVTQTKITRIQHNEAVLHFYKNNSLSVIKKVLKLDELREELLNNHLNNVE